MKDEQRRDVSAFLRKGAWFGALAAGFQDLILDRSDVRSYRKGQVVSRQGDPPLGLSALLEGRIWMVQHVGTDAENLVHVAAPGFWFGELAVLTGHPAVLTFLARTPVRTLLLPRAVFDEIAAANPAFYKAVAHLAFHRYAITLRHVAEAHRLTAEGKLRAVLADRAEMQCWDDPAEGPVDLNLSQDELARLTGLSRQTLNPLLQHLQERRLLEVGYCRIRVLDSRALRTGKERGPETGTRRRSR